MNKIDYKKEYKDIYQPSTKPMMIHIPKMSFVSVKGKGNPNEENGEYSKAMPILYGISYTIKMSKLSKTPLKGYFEYVVPPLEGFWWMEGCEMPDFQHKEKFQWISMIRLPEFVNEDIVDWACAEFKKKHPEADLSTTSYLTIEEGLCAQVMHKGPYDDEPATVEKLHAFLEEEGYELDFNGKTAEGFPRYHHEIYLGDPRKTKPENLRTVLRHPIRKKL